MTKRFNKKQLIICTLLVLIGLLMFATTALAAPTASVLITVTDDFKAINSEDLSSGIAVKDPNGNELKSKPLTTALLLFNKLAVL